MIGSVRLRLHRLSSFRPEIGFRRVREDASLNKKEPRKQRRETSTQFFSVYVHGHVWLGPSRQHERVMTLDGIYYREDRLRLP